MCIRDSIFVGTTAVAYGVSHSPALDPSAVVARPATSQVSSLASAGNRSAFRSTLPVLVSARSESSIMASSRAPESVPLPAHSNIAPLVSAPGSVLHVPKTTVRRVGMGRDEMELVEELESAVAKGDTARARALASEHARRFPTGTLSEEREGARVLTECGAGSAGGSDMANAFLNRYPNSPLRARILASCVQ